jgi:hypothetical protein
VGIDAQAALFGQFLKLFPLRLNSLIRKYDTSLWRSMSQFHYLSDDEIRASIVNQPTYLRACSFDTKTSFAVLGIPSASRYNNAEQFRRLIIVLTQCGLKPKTYKSAGADDLHIYLSFTEEVACSGLARALSRLLMHKGFELSPQTLIVYPSYAQLVLPLQAGFAWLNDDLQVKVSRDDISIESALALFLADMTRSAVSPEVLRQGFVVHEAQTVTTQQPSLDHTLDMADQRDGDVPEAMSVSEASSEVTEQEMTGEVVLDSRPSITDQPLLIEPDDQAIAPVDPTDYPEAVSPSQPACESIDHFFDGAAEATEAILTTAPDVQDEIQGPQPLDDPSLDFVSAEQVKAFFQGTILSPQAIEQLGDQPVRSVPHIGVVSIVPRRDHGTQLLLFPDLISPRPTPPTPVERKQSRRLRRGPPDTAGRSPPPDT